MATFILFCCTIWAPSPTGSVHPLEQYCCHADTSSPGGDAIGKHTVTVHEPPGLQTNKMCRPFTHGSPWL